MFKSNAAGPVARAFSFLALSFVLTSEALACPLCFSGLVITPGQKLDSADEAVLAVPTARRGEFRVVEVVKGTPDTSQPITEPATSADVVGPLTSQAAGTPPEEPAAAGKPLLLIRNRLTEQWTSLGLIDLAYAEWLRRVAAADRPGDDPPAKTWPQTTVTWSSLTDAEWRERLPLIAPELESSEPLVAEIAYGELARAPYGAMRVLEPLLDADAVLGWVSDPSRAQRRAAYLLLLGIAGDADDAAAIERRIDAALLSGDATDLAAMLAADMEIRGPDRVAWIEETFFADDSRTLPEIEAARLALSVHGGVDGTVPRQRVVEAYRFFIHEREGMAGFVAQDLADWQVWDATGDYVEILRSNRVRDPASQFAIVTYLRESPDATAQAVVDALIGASN